MNSPTIMTDRPKKPDCQQAIANLFPNQEQLPAEQRRELIMTLATIIVKQLSVPSVTYEEMIHE